GDFDGDGRDDLATYKDGLFTFDLAADGLDGEADATITFSFFGPFERPVAADLNLDGVTDIGLYITERNGPPPSEAGEWFWLVSTGVPAPGSVTTLNHAFSPVPLGNDLFFQFGGEPALPVVGNFDPPPTGGGQYVPPPNQAPTVNAGPDVAAKGWRFTGSGSFADFDGRAWTATVNYGDGSGPRPLTLQSDRGFSLSHD